jgi:hypothetical protein
VPTDAPTPEEREGRGLPDRIDAPVLGALDPGDDPKGWDRASIQLNTHPAHPLPRVTQRDLLIPSASHKLKLLGDSLVFGLVLGVLAYFPMWIADVLDPANLRTWIWTTMLAAGVGGALFLFVYASITERRFAKFLESL